MSTEEEPSKGSLTTAERWEARYTGERPPWDTGRVDRHLETIVRGGELPPCRVLEVGCGTGTDSTWLASCGFHVSAVDLSPTAIERARRRAEEAGVKVDFRVGSFVADVGRFDLVYDCGCFHTLDGPLERAAFVAEVARSLRQGGRWFSILGSTDGPSRDHGPPRRSAFDVVTAVEPRFEILSLVSDTYDADVPTVTRAWIMWARKRE